MTGKRSLSIRGHRTSISLEDAFWSELRSLAVRRHMSLAALIAEIDAERGADTNLSSAIRLHVLADALARAQGNA
ncbi:ribbon-helix-helix domain-containing protein [Aureimonas sp. AU22]|uniref:ribbon-helix-helix domain-containing protein n=1 Tax=Aureimonas sp. AU22 TaxID=1638162 RepID=UPI000781E48C|nr:ribbon-helix-helix domain-containing protein [Aureimonas sp. AU22]